MPFLKGKLLARNNGASSSDDVRKPINFRKSAEKVFSEMGKGQRAETSIRDIQRIMSNAKRSSERMLDEWEHNDYRLYH